MPTAKLLAVKLREGYQHRKYDVDIDSSDDSSEEDHPEPLDFIPEDTEVEAVD